MCRGGKCLHRIPRIDAPSIRCFFSLVGMVTIKTDEWHGIRVCNSRRTGEKVVCHRRILSKGACSVCCHQTREPPRQPFFVSIEQRRKSLRCTCLWYANKNNLVDILRCTVTQ